MADTDILSKLQLFGLSEQKAKETLKNANLSKTLLQILKHTKNKELPTGTGTLLYHLAAKIKPQIDQFLLTLVNYIIDGKFDKSLQVDAAIEHLLKKGYTKNESINIEEFESNCGVGVVVTSEQIEITVQKIMNNFKEQLLKERYHFNSFKIMQVVREELKWADAKCVKSAIDLEIFNLLGPKTDQDLTPLQKPKKSEKPVVAAETKQETVLESSGARTIADLMKTKVHFHAPGENFTTDGYVVTEHTKRLIQEHLKATGGRVQTRFPPEPNGILHIGHAKAININFGYASAHNGICYLRYDDTNPEKEEEKFFVAIKDMVNWLGYEPYKITHSSDYFQQLYDWAVELINKGLAYVCHQSSAEMKGFNPPASAWRDRPIKESLQLFNDMKNGKIDEGAATLRLKLTLEEGKVDPVAYRIKFIPHHRTGTQWCIYPTYDYTHCLCDSLENITHSLCTKEFQSRRSSYYWLCNALNIYCPVQWEYGRLNMNYTVVSKRKIAKLISERIVNDWDDPRLFTLTALRRRGIPADAINNFCAQLGVTGAQMIVDPTMLDASVRDVLNLSAPRRLVVQDPLKVTISNFPYENAVEIDVPNFPQNAEQGSHKVVLDRIIYIERTDFSLNAEKGFRRLTNEQTVGLRHAGLIIAVKEVIKSPDTGEVLELICTASPSDQTSKPKAFIQWVSQPIEIEVRLYELLFKHKNPENVAEVPNGFLSDINENSITVKYAYADKVLNNCKIYDSFQFERIGFFAVDPDTKPNSLVFNRTVGLKEDQNKN